MGTYAGLLGPMRSFGALWEAMEAYGDLWEGVWGDFWGPPPPLFFAGHRISNL